MKTMTRPEPETAPPAPQIVSARVELDASERAELAASREFLSAFRAWCVDSSNYSRMMAAFAAYQNVIRKTEL